MFSVFLFKICLNSTKNNDLKNNLKIIRNCKNIALPLHYQINTKLVALKKTTNMERTELTSKELNAKLNAIFSKVKEGCKVLESENAEKMIGRRIMAYQEGYANQEWVDEFDVVGITNEFEMASQRPYDNSKFANYAEYWESYMDDDYLEELKSNLRLLVANNINPLTTKLGWFPVDSGFMFDYNVFFTEI